MAFSDDLNRGVAPVWRACIAHPFLEGIVNSTLTPAQFGYYLYQDAYFLAEDARVMAIAASRATTLREVADLARLIENVNQAEQTRHRAFAAELGVVLEDPTEARPAPTALAYVNHLRSVALDGSLGELLAALLPCPWLYRDFGRHYADRAPDNRMYRDWLAAYASDDFDLRVRQQIALVDAVAEQVSEAERARMKRHFEVSTRYEHLFFDMAFGMEAWPDLGSAADEVAMKRA
jgi:thiaminase (transcriptional activator TenA)